MVQMRVGLVGLVGRRRWMARGKGNIVSYELVEVRLDKGLTLAWVGTLSFLVLC